jgi:subtilase family serine protease
MKSRKLSRITTLVLMAAACLPCAAWTAPRALNPLPIDRTVADERALYAKLHIQERFGFTFHPYASVCPAATPQSVRCLAKVVTDEAGVPLSFDRAAGDITGYSPKQLRSAYGVSGVASGQPIIGIVDAYGYPWVYSDLKVYSGQFNLPDLPKCHGDIASSPVPCIQVVNQNGGKRLPKTVDDGWATEQSMDVQTAHALCENCSILLVEANTNGFGDILPAENTAANLGASVISNSWGSAEFSTESSGDAQFFTHPGVVMTASTGDHGYAGGVLWPASSPNVIAVGGTSLFLKDNGKKYLLEVAWIGAGSGCSAFEQRVNWQPWLSGCATTRMVSDISADADPNTGAAVYDSNPDTCMGGVVCWFEIGGTSLSSPIVAGLAALAGPIPQTMTQPASILYENASPANSRDIIGGGTGECDIVYFCEAVPGYDGPTGLGTPKGLGIFLAQ